MRIATLRKPSRRVTGPARAGGASNLARLKGEAYTASSTSHPDMRRWLPLAGSADSDLLPELDTIVSRSRDLTRNHGIAEGAKQTNVDNIVGTGLKLVARPDYRSLGRDIKWAKEWARLVEALWSQWAGRTDCDATNIDDFDGLTRLHFQACWENGDSFALPLWLPNPARKFATRLQIIEADRVSNPDNRPDTASLRGGIEVDAYGAPVALYVRKSHPGDGYGLMAFTPGEWERVPFETQWGRRRALHLFDKGRAGQRRGKPSLTAVMRQFKVLGDFTNAELKAAVVNAMVALVTESSLSEEGLVEVLSGNADALDSYTQGLQQRNRSAIDFAAGQIVPLGLGEKLSSFTPGRPSTSFEPFVTSLFRHIAAGLNIPYELLLKDFSKTNYSSARAALLEAWRFFKGRRAWLSQRWASPVYELWLEEAINAGLIEAPDFYENRAAYCRARWIGAGRGWIDPLKEAQAAGERMRLGLSTLEGECAEQGDDWEEIAEQREYEIGVLEERGLTGLANMLRGGGAALVAPGAESSAEDPDADELADATDAPADEAREAMDDEPHSPQDDASSTVPNSVRVATRRMARQPQAQINVAPPAVTINMPAVQSHTHVHPAAWAKDEAREISVRMPAELGGDTITVSTVSPGEAAP
jgi:lambda family phage portal protein